MSKGAEQRRWGDGGKLLRFDGTHWFHYDGLATHSDLRAVFGTSPSDVWAVGQNGTAVHFDAVGVDGVVLHGTAAAGWIVDRPAAMAPAIRSPTP